jgi:hypothetical protein
MGAIETVWVEIWGAISAVQVSHIERFEKTLRAKARFVAPLTETKRKATG